MLSTQLRVALLTTLLVGAFAVPLACGSDDDAAPKGDEDGGGSEGGTDPEAGKPPRHLVDRSDVLPDLKKSVTDVALADIDGDGDLDIVWVSQDWPATGEPTVSGGFDISINGGNETFTAMDTSSLASIGRWSYVLPVDIDKDGDIDLVLTRPAITSNEITLLLNDGKGHFTQSVLPVITGTGDGLVFSRATVGDVDGDGDLDIVVGESFLVQLDGTPTSDARSDVLLVNQGGGTFARDATGMLYDFGEDYTHSIALGDITGDKRPDLFQGRGERAPRILDNGDAGSFVEDVDSGVDPTLKLRSYRSEMVDIDADGDLDVVVVNDAMPVDGGYAGTPSYLFLNDGKGHFTGAPLPMAARDSRAVGIGDVNGDGRRDIVLGYGNLTVPHGGTAIEVLLGAAGGPFTTMPNVPTIAGGAFGVAVGDLNHDGYDDIVVGLGEPTSTGDLKARLLLSQP